MVGKTAFYLVVSLFVIFCIGSVGAEPDLIVISSDKSDTGIIANQHDTATITVILSSGSIPVGNVQVNFTVVNPSMGTLNPITAFTDENGRASTIFTTGVESGIAEIRADSGSLINTTPQLIIAPVPDDTSFIKSPVEWLIANGSDSATITVYAFNSSPSFSNYPLPGLQVDFGVNNTIFGGFDPVTAITDSNGIARSTFTTKTKSGTALFYGNITYNVSNVQHLVPIEQKIDHDIPHHISEYNYSYRADAGEIVPLSFKFSDTWGNPVDNRRIAEEVNLTVSSYSSLPEGAGFVNGSDYVRSRIVPVDAEGYVRIDLKTDQVPGDNTVTIHPMIYDSSGYQTINTKSLTILGIPGKPVRIEANFIPPDFRLPADGSSVFKIVYTLWDKYDNCVHNRSVMVETSIPGEGKIVGTNPQGEIWLEYGPKWSIGKIDITATALDNASVTHTQQVFFVPQEPADVLFTVSPQTMPSREVPNRDSTWLIATVVDENGNPVSESVEVTFGFSGVTYEKQVTSDPEIPVPTAMTDEYGIAMVEFLPGEFDASNQTPATGRCDVSASWGGVTRTVPVVWKNYPYLSVEANASANLVQVNDTIDIMVLLKGDGYKLQPPPIDVILCTDRSGSMLYDNPDRMHSVREAAKVFVDEFSASRDRIGIVTFGRNGYIRRPGYNSGIPESEIHNVYDPYSGTYDGYATYDRVLTNDFIDVKTKLDRILPDHGTPMREAVRLSISTLTKNGRANALKAVVLLSDGDYNWYGDPLARGTGSSGSPTDYTDLTTNYCTFDDLGSWSARYGHTSVVMPDGSIVLMGGNDGSRKNDVWRSTDNGATWTRMTSSAGWSARQYHTSVVMPDGSIVLMGGNDGSRKNDVWRSTDNGATWTRMTSSAGWSARQYHTSVVMPDGSIVLMGGNDGSRKNDVWRSTDNGATWTRMTSSAGWSARQYHTSVVMPDGSIVLMGGNDGSRKNDVWRSTDNGATWTRMTSSAGWSARQYHTSVVMPDGSIVLMGGNDGSRKNDVWRSTDNGATWTRMTSSAGWSARQYHTSVVMPDGSIVLMGGNDGRRKNDVWRSTDNGKTWTQVIIISTGQSSNQNMSVYANNNNIKIYSIAFADDMTEGGKQTLQTLALGTGGKYYEASATDIEDIYRAIAGDLKIEAGVNTSMDLDYQKIIVNYTTEEVNDPLNPIFEYNYSYGNSTWINSYFTDNTPIDIPGLPWNFDNTSEWTDTRKLSFSLGTVHLHQVWEIRYRLIARQEGFFNLFGPQSSVTFEDADEPLTLPDLILKVNPELSDTPIKNVELYYIQTEQNRSADNSAFYVTFDLSHEYTGKNNLSEKYYIVTSDQQRHYLGYTNLTPNQTREQRQYTILSRRLPLGSIALELILTEYDKPDPLQARGEIIVFLELENPDLSKRPWYFLLT
ncbi:MAG TPA: kelch repeat-containing protein [Methanoregulaceae archaeon]|nr:kelch repeat-containing protein [Methanoregulaceae archaeon]